MRILIAEDEERMATLIARALREDGNTVQVVSEGAAAMAQARSVSWDVLILDVMLPSIDGFTVCRRLRQGGFQSAVIMLTALGASEDRVFGLDAGADDYLVKPFAMQELQARVRALSRRPFRTRGPEIQASDLVVDPLRYEAWRAGNRLELTSREFQLLAHLVRHAGNVLSRDQLVDAIWGEDAAPYGNVVDQYIYYLRSKLEQYGPRLIETVRGVGYVLREGGSGCFEPSG